MQEVTSPKRRSFSLYAIVSGALVAVGAIVGVLASVAPASAASIATNPDAQVMVFMVPLTLLVLVLMFEVARFALRSTALPAEAHVKQPTRRYWPAGHNQG